jgi:hypothetical protein
VCPDLFQIRAHKGKDNIYKAHCNKLRNIRAKGSSINSSLLRPYQTISRAAGIKISAISITSL